MSVVALPPPLPYGVSPEQLMKSAQGGGIRPAYVNHQRSEAARRYLQQGLGIQDDTTPHLDANLLRRVAEKNSILAIVMKTLVNQVAEHFRKPQSEKGIGYRIVQRDHKKAMTQGAAKMAEHIDGIMANGGMETQHRVTRRPGVWDGRYEVRADDLNTAVRKLMYDSLVLDRTFIEVEGSVKIGGKSRNPVMFWKAADAGLIRTVDTSLYQPTFRSDLIHHHDDGRTEGMVEYVMLDPMCHQGNVIREYAWDEGAMGFRNPRTEFGTFGYGKSEVEEVLDAVTGILYGMDANKQYFTNNHIPMGILNLVGNYTPDSLEELRSHFKQNIGTPGHHYEFPVIASQPGGGAAGNWIPLLDRSRQDLIFKVYMELCIVIICGIFQVQPEEVGFASFGGAASTLNSGDPESTFEQSQHKGLLPKVIWLQEFLTRNVVQLIDPDFELVIQGLEARYSQEQLLQAQYEMVLMQQGYTFNMLRRRNDEPPAVDPIDKDLWRELDREFAGKWFPNDTSRTEALTEAYEKKGGKLGSYFDAPHVAAGAMEIWKQEHGFQQEQETGEDMRNTANGELAGAQAEDAAEAQGVRDQMGNLTAAHDERDAEQSAQDDAERRSGAMSIPQAEDARTRFGGGGGGLGKSYAARRDRRRVVVEVGPRDG